MVTGTGRGAVPHRSGHVLLLHNSEQERSSKLAGWVRRGLENDEKVLYTEPPARPEKESLMAVLRANGVDTVTAQAEGRLSIIPAPDFYTAGGQLPVVERALAEGYRGLRIAVEAKTALMSLTWPAYMEVERGIDAVARTHPLSAMCQYNRTSLVKGDLDDIIKNHAGGIRERLFSTTAGTTTGGSDSELTLTGEIDMSNDDLLASALRFAASRASGVFWLNLRHVGFLSAAGCRAIDQGTGQFRDGGGTVGLVSPGPPVADALRLSGVATLDGMELVGSHNWTR